MPRRHLKTLNYQSLSCSVYAAILWYSCILRIRSRLSTDMEANSILQVIEYLNKKGYSKTEAMLRMESANQDADGRSIASRAADPNGAKYGRAFSESCHDLPYDEVTKLFSLDATVD